MGLFIDLYLIHGLDAEKYKYAKEENCFDFIRELKKRGKVKYIGISFHDSAELLEKILSEQNDIDYVQLQVNYLDWKVDSFARMLYELLKALGE